MQKLHILQANDTIIVSCRYNKAGWHSKVCNELRTNEADNLKNNPPLPKLTSLKNYAAYVATTYCLLSSNRQKMRCIAACQC